ncbi:hypothetical protein BLNAU_19001 [Blattamonas nauphoetae]|uniref:Uncharacterized protein n=1 Tax=Blattamonas nauphoetae TaxID=2049346 RepID=A0ABQ9X3C1_9EUKA|nr:hypothetical protein BLNAU_19001 [Blattamonas nauphoetae]
MVRHSPIRHSESSPLSDPQRHADTVAPINASDTSNTTLSESFDSVCDRFSEFRSEVLWSCGSSVLVCGCCLGDCGSILSTNSLARFDEESTSRLSNGHRIYSGRHR